MMTEPIDEAIEAQALEWYTRQLDGPLPAAQQMNFEAWLMADEEHLRAYERVDSLWNASAFEQALQALDVTVPAPTRRTRRWPALASAALVVLALGSWLADLPMRWQADYLTGHGEQRQFILADGSKVTLASDSAISTRIDEQQRSIRLLRGDLYVEAFHDTRRPLRVQADQAQVEVVGTRFSVSLREPDVLVAVDEGRVRVRGASASSLLGPGAWMRVQGGTLSALHEHGSAEQHGWVEGRLIFQDRPLADVLEELRRQGAAPILIFGAVAEKHVSGNYRLDDPQAVVAALAKIVGADVTRLPGGVLIVR